MQLTGKIHGLDEKLDQRDGAGEAEIDQAGCEEDRKEVEGRGRELSGTQRQLLDRDHRGQRGILQRTDGFGPEGRNHRADGLGRDDAGHQRNIFAGQPVRCDAVR